MTDHQKELVIRLSKAMPELNFQLPTEEDDILTVIVMDKYINQVEFLVILKRMLNAIHIPNEIICYEDYRDIRDGMLLEILAAFNINLKVGSNGQMVFSIPPHRGPIFTLIIKNILKSMGFEHPYIQEDPKGDAQYDDFIEQDI